MISPPRVAEHPRAIGPCPMKLSEIPNDLSIQTLRDGEFGSVGLVAHATPERLVFLESEKYLAALAASPDVSCVIAASSLLDKVPAHLGLATAPDVRNAFYLLHNRLAETDFYWKSFPTEIHETARIHPRAFVAENDVRIGPRCVIGPNATILERSILDEEVNVGAASVIGSAGFHFLPVGPKMVFVAHAGGVRLHRQAEIQSCTCVDRAIFGGLTEIGEQTKIDNLVQVAHNVKLGKRNRIAAGAMIAGSVETGDDLWIGPMVSISHMLRAGDRARLSIGAVVTKDVAPDAVVSGNFAIDHEKFIAFVKSIR
jgi:UDP-3-O-[3-hydroxymyristoyl] glucosamine N-acyltransferase